MKTVGSYEAKTHLPRLLDEVAAGETITITKHGRPVARLVPPDADQRLSVEDVIAQLRALRQGQRHRTTAAELRAWIEAGRP